MKEMEENERIIGNTHPINVSLYTDKYWWK
jgi:hypothetical protein